MSLIAINTPYQSDTTHRTTITKDLESFNTCLPVTCSHSCCTDNVLVVVVRYFKDVSETCYPQMVDELRKYGVHLFSNKLKEVEEDGTKTDQ